MPIGGEILGVHAPDPHGFQNVSFVVWKCEAVPMPELTFVLCRALITARWGCGLVFFCVVPSTHRSTWWGCGLVYFCVVPSTHHSAWLVYFCVVPSTHHSAWLVYFCVVPSTHHSTWWWWGCGLVSVAGGFWWSQWYPSLCEHHVVSHRLQTPDTLWWGPHSLKGITAHWGEWWPGCIPSMLTGLHPDTLRR